MSKEREALKLALEALELYLKMDTVDESYLLEIDLAPKAITAIKQTLAEQPAQQQEPVAWLSRDEARLALWEAINKREFGNPTDDKLILEHLRQHGLWIGKYTAPPPRQWQGLTDEEIEGIWHEHEGRELGWKRLLSRTIEATLKEKNA